MKLVLFDVDGTLILSGGAGIRALTRAFEETFGCSNGFEGIAMSGRTDSRILEEALARLGAAPDDVSRARFHERYCELLTKEVMQPGPRKGIMPGVRALLDTLRTDAGVSCALLTGNFARAARIKLEHFDLWRYFAYGAFGDDHPDRDCLVPVAVDRAKQSGVAVASMTDVLVVGDTPLDVRCAAVVGARAIAVATGSYGQAALKASGAEVVFPDLSDTVAFLRVLDDRSTDAA